MQKLHIFGLFSRLGLFNFLHSTSDRDLGVEKTPEVIYSKFLSDYPFDKYIFSLPEDIDKDKYYEVIAKESEEASNLIVNKLQSGEIPIILGGDHSISFTSLMSLQKLYPIESTGIVMFDSHTDVHNTTTSPSGNFHGMWLRPFFDKFDNDYIERLVPRKYSIKQLCYIGNQVLEKEEEDFITQNNIFRINSKTMDNEKESEFEKWIKSFSHLHISFDIDIFSSSLVKATGLPNPNGMRLDEISPYLKIALSHPNLSLDLVEINPEKEGIEDTLSLARQVIEAFKVKYV